MSEDFALIVIGPPASGKSTISHLLQKSGFGVITSGDILRDEAAKDTPLGLKARQLMANGDIIIGEDIVTPLVQKRVGEMTGDLVFDGFPRALSQAEFLDNLLGEQGFARDHICVVRLDVTDEVLRARVQSRNEQNASAGIALRKDDRSDIFEVRLAKYRDYVAELMGYYGGRVHVVSADQKPEDVLKQLAYVSGVPLLARHIYRPSRTITPRA
ncbi:MAG: nucleoside monophosphate kinase [Alphaproteobacteria bacterium]